MQMKKASHVCETHGKHECTIYNLGKGWWDTFCTVCQDEAQRKEIEAEKHKKAAAEKQAFAKKVDGLIAKADIPKRFENASIYNFDPVTPKAKKNAEAIQRYAADFEKHRADGRSIILTGNTGTGKTHLAIGLLNTLLRSGHSCKYTSVEKAASFYMESRNYGKDKRTKQKAIESYTHPELLVIDEAGLQKSDMNREILFEIVDNRYSSKKPTIMISNLTTEELDEAVGQRVTDRLRDNGGAIISFNWESQRK